MTPATHYAPASGRDTTPEDVPGSGCTRLINLVDYEAAAARVLPRAVWDYYAGGSEDEVTLHANRTAFRRVQLRPRVLADLTGCSAATTVLGSPVSLPVLLAPVGYQAMAHPDGELATARAAATAGTVMIVSINASHTIEEIATSSGATKWLQLYAYGGDLAATIPFVRRAEDSGYSALVLTVDRPVPGNRERELRDNFRPPPNARAANFGDADRVELSAPCDITWDTVDELMNITSLLILLKGILTGEDAYIAAEHGISGVVVSNHGGRQLDGVFTAVDALPEVVDAVAGRCEVYCDGGIRRGTDVIKAIALGAQAVLIGRPIVWGLAVAGQHGVEGVLSCLQEETVRAMKLLGRPSCELIDQSAVWSAAWVT